MPISKTDQLFRLIKSLTKAEKRNFKLYAKRVQSTDSLKFIQLFNLLDGQRQLDEKALLSGLKGVDKGQLSNLKRHLYKQIMVSLRLIHINRQAAIQMREYMDFADILYSKGLYLQSLKLLEKSKALGEKTGLNLISLEIIETEKLIESRHITRSGFIKNESLITEANQKLAVVRNTIQLSNLRLALHGRYVQHGHIKNKEDFEEVNKTFRENLPVSDEANYSFFERIYLFQSYVWYYYILLDFENCYTYALKWINLFKDEPSLISRDVDLLLRGYHYLLTCAFYLRDIKNFNKYHHELEIFRKSNYNKFNTNSKIISFLYVHSNRLNKHFLEGTFSNGIEVIPRTNRRIARYGKWLDPHRILVFHFKFAWMYLCNEQPDKALTYINKVLNMEAGNLREDIQSYSRLLQLMAHYDLGNYDILDYLMKPIRQFFGKMEDANQLQEFVLHFFRKASNAPLDQHRALLKALAENLDLIRQDKFEKRAFLYLDVWAWVHAKLEKKTMAHFIQELNSSR